MNSDFVLVDANVFQSRFWCAPHQAGFVTKDRPVKHYEIEFYLEDAHATYINGKEFPIRKNHILVAKPGQTRHSILDFSCLYIYIDAKSEAIRQLLEGLPSSFEISNPFQYTAIFQELIDAKLSGFGAAELLVHSKLYALLYRLSVDAGSNAFHTGNHNRTELEKARIFMEENFRQPIQLKDIAAVTSLSPAYFHKQFKKYYDQTPGEYLLNIRLTAAKKMLSVTNTSMEEIALACGFSSHAYFNAVFKKHTGLPPLKYKNQAFSKYRI